MDRIKEKEVANVREERHREGVPEPGFVVSRVVADHIIRSIARKAASESEGGH